jgi:short subunit dehydrogenase-like uncharacterized protein
MPRPYDIVVFGASGFTGEYVVEYLVKHIKKSGSNLKWAVAGRSESKVKATLLRLSSLLDTDLSSTPIIIASVGDDHSLDSMNRQAVLLINCTGPFRYYGEAVVSSCVRCSTHYTDISGEPQFMENVQLKYHSEAMDNGIYVVPSCGFDSIPCDIGVNFLKDAFKPGRVCSVETFLTTIGDMTGNNTTWDCAVEGFADVKSLIKVRKALYSSQFQEVSKIKSKFPLKQRPIGKLVEPSAQLSGWIMPFVGADRSVVRRSQMANYIYFNEPMVQMDAYVIHSFWLLLRWVLTGVWLKVLSPYSWGRSLLKKFPRFFTNGLFREGGPDREETDSAAFSIVFLGRGWKQEDDEENEPRESIVSKVSGPHPGYPTCAICVIQAAVVLLEETSSLPSKGGCFTPATAFRNTTLIKRLNSNGLKFEVL